MTDGTPLPAALSGVTVQRLIEIDQALLYLVTGALSFAAIREPLEQTGALTPDTAQDALNAMIEVYLNERPNMTPVGSIMFWTMEEPPDRWIVCDGGGYLKSEYPELWALWGTKYGTSPDFFGSPNMFGRFPFGADFAHPIDDVFGEDVHTLTVAEMPAHGHNIKIGTLAGSGAHPHANTNQATQSTSYAAIADTGGGGAHNNMPPGYGGIWIAYGGRP